MRKRKRQVVFEDAVAGTPVLGVLHVASNQDNDRRVDTLILYVRSVVGDHDAMAP